MGFIKYLFSYKENMEYIDTLEHESLKDSREIEYLNKSIDLSREEVEEQKIQITEAENMLENYKQSLATANEMITKCTDIITVRDQELQEWDDINNALTEEIKELIAKAQPSHEQVQAAERFRKSFDELLNYNQKTALKRK